MTYAADHAGAYADVLAAGAAVTFSTYTPGTYAPATDAFSAASSATVTGVALEVGNAPLKFDAEALTEAERKTFLFVPATYGDMPPLGATVAWASKVWTVRQVADLSPDGTAILGKIEVTR